RLGEEHDPVHARERREDFGALARGNDRAARSLVAAHARVGVDGDDQAIAVAARLLEAPHVADVQQVEAAVGEDDAFAAALRRAPRARRVRAAQDLRARVHDGPPASARGGGGFGAGCDGGAVGSERAAPLVIARSSVESPPRTNAGSPSSTKLAGPDAIDL